MNLDFKVKVFLYNLNMKYNTTYMQKVSLKDTITTTNDVLDEIKKFYKSRFKVLNVLPPVFLEEDNEMLIDIEKVTRPITFDLSAEYKVGQVLLTQTNWIRSMIHKLNMEGNNAIEVITSTVWRDLDVNPVSSVTKNEVTIQVVLDADEDVERFMKIETDSLYDLIETLETEYSTKFKLDKNYPQFASYITAQMMENEYPNIDYKAREEEFATELGGYVLVNPGQKLFSGHVHTEIPVELYSTNRFNQILLKDSINSSVLKVASVAELATGQKLSDQLSLFGKANLKEKKFYSDLINTEKKIVEIKINIGRLVMALLKKGHISEVQAGEISDESNTISTRYKVDKY